MTDDTMVVVHAAIRIRPAEVERVRTLARDFVAEVHLEPGCVAYELSWDNVDPGVLRLIEHWESAETYESHRVQPHVAVWAATMLDVQESPVRSVKLRAEAYA